MNNIERTAIVSGSGISAARVAAFLPANYRVVDADLTGRSGDTVLIAGTDNAGWTLDGYVIPRLASGCLWATEVEPWVEACDEVARPDDGLGDWLAEGHARRTMLVR